MEVARSPQLFVAQEDSIKVTRPEAKVNGFTMIPDDLLQRPDLTTDAKVLYSRWLRFKTVPHGKKIAEVCGMTYNVFRKTLAELVDAGMIAKVGHGRYEIVLCDTSNVREDTRTRETTKTIRKPSVSSSPQTSGDNVIIGSFGSAEDLPEPRATVKWNAGSLARRFRDDALVHYFGKPGAQVNVKALSGQFKRRIDAGISPDTLLATIEEFMADKRWVAQSSTGVWQTYLGKLDILISKAQRASDERSASTGTVDYW